MKRLPRLLINLLAPGPIAGTLVGLLILITGGDDARRDAGLILTYGILYGAILGLALSIPHTVVMEILHARGLAPNSARCIAVYAGSGFLLPWITWAMIAAGRILTNSSFDTSSWTALAGLSAIGLITGALVALLVRVTARD